MKKEKLLTLQSLLTGEEYNSILADTRDTMDNCDLLRFLLDNRFLLQVDCKGEQENNEIINFVKYRVDAFGEHLDLDPKKFAKKISKSLKNEKIERHELVFYIVKQIKKQLHKDYTICNLQRERDQECYYLGVITKKALKKLSKEVSELGQFQKFEDKSDHGILYMIDCQCGQTNLWDLTETEEAPKEGICDNCGTELFNKDGSSKFSLVIDKY